MSRPELSRSYAKKAIKALYEQRHGEVLFPDDVAKTLHFDLGLTIELCKELADEGRIAEMRP